LADKQAWELVSFEENASQSSLSFLQPLPIS
jgi:hypothetical protein